MINLRNFTRITPEHITGTASYRNWYVF